MRVFLMSSNNKIVVNIKVIPNSTRFFFEEYDAETNTLRMRVKSKAIKGKANAEILNELRRIFGKDVEIISGKKSGNKRISISAGESAKEKFLSLVKVP